VTSLVTGIVSDVQELLGQQLALFKRELESDLSKTRDAALTLLVGLGIAGVGAGMLFLMLVHLLHWATDIPLWGCHGLVGGGLALVGGALFYAGKKKFDTFNPLPDESVHALKENVQCLMKPK
jgi:hypothetical protein